MQHAREGWQNVAPSCLLGQVGLLGFFGRNLWVRWKNLKDMFKIVKVERICLIFVGSSSVANLWQTLANIVGLQ